MLKEVIYLATPFSHKDPMILHSRAILANQMAGKLIKEGHVVFAPIPYGWDLCRFHTFPTDFTFWETFCYSFLKKCDKMIVYKIDGWAESKGVAAEIVFCENHNIPVEYLDYDEKYHENL